MRPSKLGQYTVQVFFKAQFDKRGKWSSPRIVLSYNKNTGTVTVPGKNSRKIQATVEDLRLALPENSLSNTIKEGIDTIARSLDECMDTVSVDDDARVSVFGNEIKCTDDEFEIGNGKDDDRLLPAPSVGDNIEVHWPLDDTLYPATVASIDYDDNKVNIDYTDGQKESLNMTDEVWRYTETTTVNNVQIPERAVKSSKQDVLGRFITEFGHKEFMQFQAQGLPSFPLSNAYKEEEDTLKRTVQMVHISKVPKDANIITSHVIYKVKPNDDGSSKVKARIAPHNNQDAEKLNLKTDYSVCPPIGIRILLSLAVIFKWCLAKSDFKSAFLQTGDALRNVYVVPPKESENKQHLWLLLAAAYGLVNANAKWQEHSDHLLHELGFKQLVYVPQLFYFQDGSGNLSAVAVKIVDDVLMTGPKHVLESVIAKIKSSYKLGTVVFGPGTLLFFGLQISQDTDYSISIQGDDKLSNLQCHPLFRQRMKEGKIELNDVEKSSF